MSDDLPSWARKAKTGWSEFQDRRGLTSDGLPGLRTLGAVLQIEKELSDRPTLVEPPGDGFSYGGEELRPGVSRDPKLLLAPFAAKVESLFNRLRSQGHDPMLFEGYRTPERAQKLSDIGTGIPDSMHCYGGAVDILHSEGWWSAPPEFWDAIGDEAEALGMHLLYRGGKRRDRPHVQAMAVRDQHRFRAMTGDERLAFVA